jgi:hypothetical protein
MFLRDNLTTQLRSPCRPTLDLPRAHAQPPFSHTHTRTRNAYAQAHRTLFHRCGHHPKGLDVALSRTPTCSSQKRTPTCSSQKRHHTRNVLMHHHLRGGHGSGHQPVLQKHEADMLWFSSTAEGGELDAEGVVALCFVRWSLLTMINTYEHDDVVCIVSWQVGRRLMSQGCAHTLARPEPS